MRSSWYNCRLMTMLLLLLLLALSSAGAAIESAIKPPVCQLVYGIRMSRTGTVEKVLDAARCQNADAAFIQSFLEQVKPQVDGNVLELEISDSHLPKMAGRNVFSNIGLRRLSIRRSGLETLALDIFDGQENLLEELDLSDNRLEEIPAAIRNLTALSRLDVSRNRIRSLPQGVVFFHLLKLRHLNLNYNRLGYLDTIRYPTGVAAGQTLPLAIFNLEPLREHIETLLIRSNNMSAFPDQFSRPFGRLRHLDLSSNNIQSIPVDAFSQMPQLGSLQLDNNRLNQIGPLQLSPSLRAISLRGNPVKCDCGAVWLRQWMQAQRNQSSTGVEIQMDDCVRPDYWKGQRLIDLPLNFCQLHTNATAKAETKASPKSIAQEPTEDIVQYVSLGAAASSDAINVTLLLLGNISTTVNWTITYRQFGTPKPIGSPITGLLTNRTTQTLVGLKATTGYHVCVRLEGRANYQDSYQCLEVTTPAENATSYPVTEVAVAASVSTSTTLVVVILVCCCCPRVKCGKKNKKLQDRSLDGSTSSSGGGEREAEPKTKVFSVTSSAVIESESTAIWPNVEQLQPTHFSTFHGNGTLGRHHQQRQQRRPSEEEQSHKVFQATCNYLRQRALDPSRGMGIRGDSQHLQIVQQHRASGSTQQVPVYLAPIADGQYSVVGRPKSLRQQVSAMHYFNSSYGLSEFNPNQTASLPPDNPYKYCTWRPVKQSRPLLSSWTSYPDFLANSGSFQHPLSSLPLPPPPSHQPAIAVPVYSLTTACRPRRKRDRFYWSAAPAPIHTVELQF